MTDTGRRRPGHDARRPIIGDPDVDLPDIDLPGVEPEIVAAIAEFLALDTELPLALFPVRLEARFLPDAAPEEIVVRIFPDDVLIDDHDAELTPTELTLATSYWETVWRAAGEATATSEAREWLAGQLGAGRAAYVAGVTQPDAPIPAEPTSSDEPLDPPPPIPDVDQHDRHGPAVARLLPTRWVAFVEVGGVEWTTYGPFWASEDVADDLVATPALTELPPGADARDFLDRQGLGWTHRIDEAEAAGMVVRIPLDALELNPDEPRIDRLYVFGIRPGTSADDVAELFDAHRRTGGLELLAPGTPTNRTDDTDTAATTVVDLDALFDSELDAAASTSSRDPGGPRDAFDPHDPAPGEPFDPIGPGPIDPIEIPLLHTTPAAALNRTFGLTGASAFDRTALATAGFPQLALAAVRVFWSATWGKFLSGPMRWFDDGAPLIDDIDAERDWFMRWVRPDGPLATLQVGRQPYGVLPVNAFDTPPDGEEWAVRNDVLAELFDYWSPASNANGAPVLDPDSADVAPADEAAENASDVGAVLGATPHVRELRTRFADDTSRELADKYNNVIGLGEFVLKLVPDQNGDFVDPDDLPDYPWFAAFLDHQADIEGASGATGQLDALRDLDEDLTSIAGLTQSQRDAITIAADYFHNSAIPLVESHLDRLRPYEGVVTWELLEQLGTDSALGAERAPRLASSGYGDPGTETPLGTLVAADGTHEELAEWLREVADDVDDFATSGVRPDLADEQPATLFRHLVVSSVATIAQSAARVLASGLERFASEIDEHGAAAVPTLERAMRAALGPAMYRVDAWITGTAIEDLATKRDRRGEGLQTGCYGWLVDLAPRAGRASQGHIHAPSLEHATTAAVLRSGWSAFGTSDEGGALTVDLSSPRIRAARSLIEGVRSGQELGRLLGARFERRLHDRHLDRYIDDVRGAVLAGAGTPDRPPTRIVDGLLLARAFTDGIEQTQAERDTGPLVEALGGYADVRSSIDETVADLDAVADLLLSQSVHALLRGNAGVAASSLAATGSGDSGLPPIDFPATRSTGTDISVRVAAFLDGTGPAPGWNVPADGPGLAEIAEPRLEHWVGRLLGPADHIVVLIDKAGTIARVTIGELGIGAIDAVLGADALAALAIEHVGASTDAHVVAGPDGRRGLDDDELSHDEFVALARSIGALFSDIRPLRRADLTQPSVDADVEIVDDADLGGLLARLDDLVAAVPPDDPRHEELAAHTKANPSKTVDLVIERIHIMVGAQIPVFPELSDGVPDELFASFAQRADDANRPETAAWLAQASRVRGHVASLVECVELAELIQDRALSRLAIAQLPDDGGPWIGTSAPRPSPAGSSAYTAWCSMAAPPPKGPVAGFVADSWTDVVPTDHTTSGIAVHFDSPSARAPNAILLASARSSESFAIDRVLSTLRSTLSLAQLRALGADDPLFETGQFTPAVFLDDDVVFDEDESADAADVVAPEAVR